MSPAFLRKAISMLVFASVIFFADHFACTVKEAIEAYINIDKTQLEYLYIFDVSAFLLVLFLFSIIFNNISFIDVFWSLWPVSRSLRLYIKYHSGADQLNLRQFLLVFFICFWGIRLAVQWVKQWKGFPEMDFRYQDVQDMCFSKTQWWLKSFSMFFLAQGIFVFCGTLPVFDYMMQSDNQHYFMRTGELIGFCLMFYAVSTEAIADYELYLFKQSNKDHTHILEEGLWKYSRHPNYWGEMVFWWGIWFYTQEVAFNYPIGASLISMMFITGSVKMMESKLKHNKNGYRQYKQRVISALAPCIRLRYN